MFASCSPSSLFSSSRCGDEVSLTRFSHEKDVLLVYVVAMLEAELVSFFESLSLLYL